MILLFLFGLLLPLKAQVSYTAEDTVIFDRFLQYAGNGNRDIIPIARFFIDTPYVGGTLEGDSAEQLRVNLREQDCVTLVENVLVLHLMLQSDDHNFGNFCRTLQQIRYRNGSPDGYLSRLHYTSEWLDCNCRKGIIGLPELPQCVPFAPNVSFMSAHCDKYPALKMHPDRCAGMKKIEKRINTLKFCYIPKEQVGESETAIKTGDIVAITTHIKGLDIAHTGFALLQNGTVFYYMRRRKPKKW